MTEILSAQPVQPEGPFRPLRGILAEGKGTSARPKLLALPSGARILHTKCKPVGEITPAIRSLVQALEDCLEAYKDDKIRLVSVSAPQLGKLVRVFSCVLDAENNKLTVINPELVYEKKRHFVVETCLSVPNRRFMVKRGKTVKIRGMLVDGSTRSFKAHGLLAQAFLHELDHLDGTTIDIIGTEIQ